ncbi:MAG TPA: hypothetical protein VFB35_02080 [Gaiellaceae bacterium]|nr:hypothetical protein [Gaiellaceae bacterium]
MTRVFGLVLVLVALAVGAYLAASHAKKDSPASPAVSTVVDRAASAAAATNFQGAAVALQAWFTANATYAGATLPPGSGVVLARADSSSYCLQTTVGAVVEHEVGPGGQAQPGPC